MKIRNNKTGEIGYLQNDVLVKRIRVVNANNDTIGEYNSLTELNSEWEDAPEEPKGYWYINSSGAIDYITLECDTVESIYGSKQIGNYFCTREEAEKAVEKLKAVKRLKDKGFKFIGVRGIGKVIDFDIPEPFNHVGFDDYVAGVGEKEFYNDLLLLFGGEE